MPASVTGAPGRLPVPTREKEGEREREGGRAGGREGENEKKSLV